MRSDHTVAILCLLVLMVVVSPLFIGPAEFVGDDSYFIVENARVTTFSLASLKEIWTTPMKIEYFPVTVTTYFLEHAFWGNAVKLYRLTNLLLFIAVGFCSYRLIQKTDLLGEHLQRTGILVMLAVFAMMMHPANVETVAAISHRKELLYVLFGLLALISYTDPAASRKERIKALIFVALAQLSKGSAVILPLLLAACELYRSRDLRDFLARLPRLIPFAVVTVIGFAIQFNVALKAGVVGAESFSLATRLGGVIRTANALLGILLFPRGICYDYDIPWPAGLPPFQEWLLPLLILTGLLALGCLRRFRTLFACCAIALLPLIPYLNIIPLGHTLKGQMVVYDHYLFFTLALLPLAIVALSGLFAADAARILCIALGALSIGYAGYDYYLTGFWRTRETLYSRLVQLSPNLPKGHFFLSSTYLEKERYFPAIQQLKKVFTSRQWYPEFVDAYLLLGDAYCFSGNYKDGTDSYRRYLTHKPGYLKALQNLSTALIQMKEYNEAKQVVETLLAKYPGDAIGMRNRGMLGNMGL